MASYAMAHLQLDLLLKETGFKAITNQRTRVYLTNSLEEYHPDTGTLFANWLSSEANEANHIKRDTPVMCVIGNPPYAVSSTNKNSWIENLIADYKKNLNETSYNSLSDDYVKFIRYGQHYIDKNGFGILAYISNNSFIDGIVFRQMRKNLLESFDKIYVLNLHGNAKKKEVCPDGSVDQNVFDIMQGVSINIFVKTGLKKKNELGQVFYSDVYGKRNFKYSYLNDSQLNLLNWKKLKSSEPNYYFVDKDFRGEEQYIKGISINELFQQNNVGIVTARDAFTLHFSKDEVRKIIQHFISLSEDESRAHFKLGNDARDWKVSLAKTDIVNNYPDKGQFTISSHRPFDERWTYYTGNSKGFHSYPRYDIMKHMLRDNLALIAPKQAIKGFKHVFISKNICDKNYTDSAGQFGAGNVFPLYLYPDFKHLQITEILSERQPNLNQEIVNEIALNLDLTFTNEKESTENTFAPIDILDYIYAILHSPTYRDKYKEFLKIDFPRVPYPKDVATFWLLVKLGGEIRQIHLLESPRVEDYITSYPKSGDNKITTKINKKDWELFDKENRLGRIWINREQYFDNIPLVAWEFYIGGYQPAQKWLKDRKERTLEHEDVLHYQKIIVALMETDRLMKDIDKIEIE